MRRPGYCDYFQSIALFHKLPIHKRMVITATLFFFLAFSLCAGFGCGDSSSTANLKDYPNKFDLQFEGPMFPAMVKGSILESQTTSNQAFVKIKVSSFDVLPSAVEVKNASVISPGSQVVLEVDSPKTSFPKGKNVQSSVRVVRTQNGLKFLVESPLVL